MQIEIQSRCWFIYVWKQTWHLVFFELKNCKQIWP